MIRLRRPAESDALGSRTIRYLARRQSKADMYAAGVAEIGSAWKAFLRTKSRQDVARALDAYHRSKCAYCEQVAAKDIEHFYPKSAYPRRMFRWDNFVRGCKNCNNAKLDKFPLDGNSPILLDPCADEPLDYLAFDFDTGRIGSNPSPDRKRRADETCGMFDLNQEPLREERRAKLMLVLYLLAQVVKEDPVSPDTAGRLHDALAASRPWLGIVRQLFKKAREYRALVETAIEKLPEINEWTAEWL